MQGLTPSESISFILVFLEGLLSFFSPCVIPLIPIYISYLSGNAKQVKEDGTIIFQRKKVFFHTLCFVLGISFAFFILGMSFTALGTFFKSNQLLFSRIGGILILILGLYQVGLLDINFLQRERKFQIPLGDREANPLLAFAMGFTFSFAWTPCVGPALSSVLILASGTGSSLTGNLLVLVYSLGFVIPFLLLGLFTTQVLNFLNVYKKLLKYTVKAGGILLIIIGIMTFTGWMNGVTKYLSILSPPTVTREEEDLQPEKPEDNHTASEAGNTGDSKENEKPKTKAFDFTLTDQFGNEHTLSDYKGKVVFLNFWSTWCPPCQKEMPNIEEVYKKLDSNQGDVIILGVSNPSSTDYPNNADESKESVIAYLEKNKYTFPTVFDETGEILQNYFVSAFPTTFLIDKEGNFFGYATGIMTKSQIYRAIEQALAATE
ncbi:MAG: redoxin domain-containing protein [Lachnospiraceae bacterium]|nr:redoxin domain-containing protein [Lachnospiraceae bacterium]